MAESFDTYLASIARQLTVTPASREEILLEVRSHLEEAAQRLLTSGMDRSEAQSQAIAEFGIPAAVAAHFNAVHPVYWDLPRFLRGILWGMAAVWGIWTLVTFPFIVQAALTGRLLPAFQTFDVWELLFQATPLAFGIFNVLLRYPVLVGWLFLLLYGVVPFVWGRRAQSGWRPGLAYGLAVIIGFPWLLPALVSQWGDVWDLQSAFFVAAPVLGIWLLAPLAMLMSWLGKRSATFSFALALRRNAHVRHRLRAVESQAQSRRQPVGKMRIALLGIALVVLGVNVWSIVRLSAHTEPTPAQQLRQVQAVVPFTIHVPSYLAAGLQLAHVTQLPTMTIQGTFQSVLLEYQGRNGQALYLNEYAVVKTELDNLALQVSEGNVGASQPIWWLGDKVTTYHEINIDWSVDGMHYDLSADGFTDVAEIRRIAASV